MAEAGAVILAVALVVTAVELGDLGFLLLLFAMVRSWGFCFMFWPLFRSYREVETQLASLVVVLSGLALQRVTDPSCRAKADLHDEGKKTTIYPSQICKQCRCRLHS